MSLFEQHPLRQTLNDEVHARPPVPLDTPEFVTYLAFLHHEGSAGREAAHLAALAEQLGVEAPAVDSGHVFLDGGGFRLKWERHNEFSSYTFFRRIQPGDTDDEHALLAVPAAWRKAIPGRLITATHIELRGVAEIAPESVTQAVSPRGETLVAAQVAGGSGWVFTDFQIKDGFSRFLLLDAGLTPRQAGRTVQRLVEIETYRVMALLAFPVAKEVGRLLSRAEDELANLMDSMGEARSSEDDRKVLGRLTKLAADVERSVARTTFRFGAAAAYYRLVGQRIEELRETRYDGFPTIDEFMQRRLAPAIATCATIARRQEDLSGRIARNSQLLRTRVDIELERQNQELLAQMNRRAKIQLHLQETVEGLSVVAITYYASQLVNYVAKGAKDIILPATPEIITAVSIPVIACLVALGLRRMRKALTAEDGGGH
ncbi:DUF3422 family protein [Azoarcus indigens]|uniref:Putative membrane-anchored protein n=1 Tax=Azoarcus indigens TaxID=29545 RepID=A0A4R6DMM1_9RHOO|nr:DUF3422 domain-containing protein [Azoarcus indigens]NMG65741.1 DUF3422 family protein [Azoarcus indigens]TDN46097.1 putative membrane-anchored protein [Azoarcus indigens]